MQRFLVLVVLSMLAFGPRAGAETHAVNIPLDEGRLRCEEVTSWVCAAMHLPGVGFGSFSVDLGGLRDSSFVAAVNKALPNGAYICIDRDNLHLELDPSNLPHSCDSAKQAIRIFTAT